VTSVTPALEALYIAKTAKLLSRAVSHVTGSFVKRCYILHILVVF